jgi:hypothetical protein
MTIAKGTGWGYGGTLSPDSPTFNADADVAAFLAANFPTNLDENREENPEENRENKQRGPLNVPPIGLTGGALWRTIGGPGVAGRYLTNEARHYTCDLAVVMADGIRHVFVASLVARNRWWTKAAAVMNAQDMGAYRFGHRAHPGDALLDVYEAHVAISDVAKIAKRAKLGSHLPHPGISERRLPTVTLSFAQPRQLWLDERRTGTVEQLQVTVVPDAFIVVV